MNKLIINQHELNGLVNKICRDIVISDWRPDYIVGLSRGGLMPAVMISHYLNVPMRPLQVSLRDGGDCVSDLGMSEDAFGHLENLKNILIVDDINDTGATFNWIMKDWPSGCFPDDPTWGEVWNDNVRFAVVVDNLSSNCDVPMDYVGKEINKAENDVWVDFPWEDWWAK
jgi:xanthine phosphoribosyltransferase